MTKNDIGQILDRICSGIASKSERSDARDELYDHIMNHYEKNIACGLTEDEAYSEAVKVLGDKDEIHNFLKRVHKYKKPKEKISIAIEILAVVIILMVIITPLLIFSGVFLIYPPTKLERVVRYDKPALYVETAENFINYGYHYLLNGNPVKIPVFPATIDDGKIAEFNDIHYEYNYSYENSEMCWLTVKYDESEYETESERLKKLYRTDACKMIYGVTGAKEGYTVLAIYADNDALIYALSDNYNTGNITYAYFDIREKSQTLPARYKKDFKSEYLLNGFNGQKTEIDMTAIKMQTFPPELQITEYDIPAICWVKPVSYTWHALELPYSSWSEESKQSETDEEIQFLKLVRNKDTVNKYSLKDKTSIEISYNPTIIKCNMTNCDTGETIKYNLNEKGYLPEGEWLCEIEAEWNDKTFGGTGIYKFRFINK